MIRQPIANLFDPPADRQREKSASTDAPVDPERAVKARIFDAIDDFLTLHADRVAIKAARREARWRRRS
jgi:hypothetical protein